MFALSGSDCIRNHSLSHPVVRLTSSVLKLAQRAAELFTGTSQGKPQYLQDGPFNPNMDNPNFHSIQSPVEITCRSLLSIWGKRFSELLQNGGWKLLHPKAQGRAGKFETVAGVESHPPQPSYPSQSDKPPQSGANTSTLSRRILVRASRRRA